MSLHEKVKAYEQKRKEIVPALRSMLQILKFKKTTNLHETQCSEFESLNNLLSILRKQEAFL